MSEKEEGKELVKLDPQNISSTKEEVRVNYFNNLRGLVDYGNGQLTPEQINRVKNTVKHLRAGFQAAMPITCTGKDHCPNVDFCPLVKIESETGNPNVMPVGKRCPIEGELLATWAQDYCEALKLTEDDIFDLTLVKELAELDLQELRISNYLSKSNKAVGVGENVVGLDPDTGAPIMVEQISPAMELKLKIKDRRNRILESLVQTRKEKYKRDAALKQPPADDASSSLAAMKSLLEAAMIKRQSKITNLVQDQDGVYKPEPTTPTK